MTYGYVPFVSQNSFRITAMQALFVAALFGVLAYASAGGLGLGLAGSVDGGAILSGPSGVVQRGGLAAVGPIGAPGAIIAGAAPGAILAGGHGLIGGGAVLGGAGLGLGGGLGLGLGGIANPGLAAKVLGLEGSGIEGQWIPDINEKLHDDGSYKPHVYGL
ncbi:uncharacterized protein LOC126734907 [Anthonomus grandis grandis]|uniref:uncharacterized protein LOC126734907 n=1 Tax=Anthonomus grandis grandis TaxID=2921223 RepID=UPI0021657CFA|nr:uncharacterized protein LOC126734907 [Anthonomus grandis grandis]